MAQQFNTCLHISSINEQDTCYGKGPFRMTKLALPLPISAHLHPNRYHGTVLLNGGQKTKFSKNPLVLHLKDMDALNVNNYSHKDHILCLSVFTYSLEYIKIINIFDNSFHISIHESFTILSDRPTSFVFVQFFSCDFLVVCPHSLFSPICGFPQAQFPPLAVFPHFSLVWHFFLLSF